MELLQLLSHKIEMVVYFPLLHIIDVHTCLRSSEKITINLLFNWFIYFPVFCKYFCTSAQGFNQHSWERQAGIVWIFRQNGEFFNTLIWKVCILEFTLHCRTLVKLWKNEIKYFTLWIWMKLRSFKMSTLNLVWVAKQHKNI